MGGMHVRVISLLSDDPSGIIRAKGRPSQLLYTLKGKGGWGGNKKSAIFRMINF